MTSNSGWRGNSSRRESARPSRPQPDWTTAVPKGAAGQPRRVNKKKLLASILGIVAVIIIAYLLWDPAKPLRTASVFLNLLEKPADFENQLGFQIPQNLENTIFQQFQAVEPNELEKGLQADHFKDDDVVLVLLQTHLIPISGDDFACVTQGTNPDLNKPRKLSDVMSKIISIRDLGKNVLLVIDSQTARADWRTDLPGCELRSFFEKYVAAEPATKEKPLGSLTIVCSAASSGDSEPGSPKADGMTRLSYAFRKSFSRESLAKDEDLGLNRFLTSLKKFFNEFPTPGIGFRQPELLILGKSPDKKMETLPEQLSNFVLFRKMQQQAPNIPASKDDPELLKKSQDLWAKMEKENFASRWPEQWNSTAEQLVWAERAYFQGRNSTAETLIKVAGDRLDQALKQQQQTIAAADSADATGSLKELSSQLEAAYQKYSPGNDKNQFVTLRHDFEDVVKNCETEQCVHLLYDTLRKVHQQLLEAEDRSFSLQPKDRLNETEIDKLETLVTSLKNFAQAYGDAFRTADKAMRILPGTTFWCSKRSTLPAWAASESEWLPHLNRLCDHSDGRLSLEDVADLEATLKARQDASASDSAVQAPPSRVRAARTLRSHAILSLAYSRGLMKELHTMFTEPDERSDKNVLSDSLWVDRTNNLKGWTTKAAQELKSLEEEFRNAIDEDTATLLQGTDEQSLQHAFLYETLPLTFMGSEQRRRVHDKLREIRKTASGLAVQPSTDEADMQRRALTELRWATALSNLLVSIPPEQRKRLSEIAMKDDQLSHDDIAEASAKLRSLWSGAGTEVRASYDNVERDAFPRAVASSLSCRLLTEYDLPDSGEKPQSVVDRVSFLNRLESHLLHADLITQSGWSNGEDNWYHTTAEKCLAKFDALAKNRKPPTVLLDHGQRIQKQWNQKYELKLALRDPKLRRLGSDEHKSERIEIGGEATLPDYVNGFGAIRFMGASTSIPSGFYRFGDKEERQTIELKSTGPVSLATTITREGDASETGCEHDIPVHVFFRGRMWSQDTPLKISACSPIKYTTTIEERKEKAVISVEGKDPHPVVFVLDWSDSMKNELQPGGQQRYQAAADTLKLLAQNANLGESKVILRVFGHRTRVRISTGDKIIEEKIPEYQEFFNKENTAGHANEDTETEFQGRLSNPAKLQDFIDTIDALEKLRIGGKKQTGITPLLQSIIEALVKDLNNGPGTVIAITDGEPTDDGLPEGGDEAIKWDKRDKLRKALAANDQANIKIVTFDIAAQELEPLRQTFVNDTRMEAFKNRIELINATDKAKLSQALSVGLDPRPFIASDSQGDQPPTELNEQIKVDPGQWRVRMESSQLLGGDPGYRLNRGDTLKLSYEFNNRRFLLSGRTRKADKLWPEQDLDGVPTFHPTRITGHAKLMRDAQVNVSLWLERFSPAQFVEQPAEIEIQVAANGKPLKSITQTYDSSDGVPGWKLECSDWPKEARAKLNVAWKMTRTMPDEVWQCDNDLLSHGNFESAIRLEGKNLPQGKVWFRDFLNGAQRCFEVRIDPLTDERTEENPVDRVRIELGRRTAVGQNETFTPWELRTEVIRVDKAVVFRFYSDDNQLTADSIRNLAEIAFTSLRSRSEGAIIANDLDIGVH